MCTLILTQLLEIYYMYDFLYVLNFFFFKLLFVDVNNDGFLDEQELEALFTKEVKKKYSEA